MNLSETFLAAILLSMCVGGCSSCPSKPKDCSSELITFHLYNRNHPNGLQLKNDGNNDATLFTHEQFKIIFHGYSGGKDNSHMVPLRDAYLKLGKYSNINIIQIDYTELAKEGCYWVLLRSLSSIGKCAAEFIKNKILGSGIAMDKIHVIGFSYGAHAAAVTSEKIRGTGLFPRLTGIDPALFGFTFPFPGSWHKLNRSHAKFVDVIHSNSGMRGVYSSNAHFDFYASNGMSQHGCAWNDFLCSHKRGIEFFIESVNSEIGFYAVKCGRISIFFGRCKFAGKEIPVGEPCSPPEKPSDEGSYFFPTREVSPYAVGRPQPKPAAPKPA